MDMSTLLSGMSPAYSQATPPVQYPSPIDAPAIAPSHLAATSVNNQQSDNNYNTSHLSQPFPKPSQSTSSAMSTSSTKKRQGPCFALSQPSSSRRRNESISVKSPELSPLKTSKRKSQKDSPHSFTLEQVEWLAEELTDPSTCSVLQGKRDADTNRKTPKAKVYKRLAEEFNEYFHITLGELQIKNKIAKMIKSFHDAETRRNEAEFGDTSEEKWRQVPVLF